MPAFFDSNILLYAIGDDGAKTARSDRLIGRGGWISVQVLNEVANVCIRKRRLEWPRAVVLIRSFVDLLQVADVTLDVHRLGCELAERYHLAVYDAMIVAAALTTGCEILYSEDMHHGLVIDGRLTITNPFASRAPIAPA